MSPPISMGLGLSLSEVRTIAAGATAAVDWELVESHDLNDGGGPYSAVDFQSLALNERYLVVGVNLKGDTVSTAQAELVMLSGVTAYSSSYYVVEAEGARTEIATGTGASSGLAGINAYVPLCGWAGNTLVDAGATTSDDLDGLFFAFDMWLPDQGTADVSGYSLQAYIEGPMNVTSVEHGGSFWMRGGIYNDTAASRFDGFRIRTSSDAFADIAGATISLYKYTGGVA